MDTYVLSGITFALALGLILLILYSLRKANIHNLVAIAAGSFVFVFALGFTAIHSRQPADEAWIQEEFINQTPTGQAFMAQYFEIRSRNKSLRPITNAEFNMLLVQMNNLAPASAPDLTTPAIDPKISPPPPSQIIVPDQKTGFEGSEKPVAI